ncbi:MAG: excinuclease ABC subunit UvrB [Candidatus Neomarinimicrobiota bacterium]
MNKKFKVHTPFEPAGDQPQAIKSLTQGLKNGDAFQTLLGITGSGKTYTMAKVIEQVQRPTLIISHNKTLAAQLYGEFKSFFPENAVEYFISYYDYYQPEAYIATTDTYIEKDSDINEEIEKLRLKATTSLLGRRDTIVIASVSCIFGLGSPKDYEKQIIVLRKGESITRKELFQKLVFIHYSRNDISFSRSTFRVRGDSIEIYLAYEDSAIRLEFWGDEMEKISSIEPLTGKVIKELDFAVIYPARHFITDEEKVKIAINNIKEELKERLNDLRQMGKLLEAQRLEQRTNYDIEMIQELGYCSGIENYSRHLTLREEGSQPFTLMDFFPDDFITIIDESHATIPQIHAMYNGDRSRKNVLVEHGFRLPSAFDNRPLKFHEFEDKLNQAVFVSATPSDYEVEKSEGVVVEQIIRPTGLLDPNIVVRPTEGQIDDLINEIQIRAKKKERVLVTTLTKRESEDLSNYLKNINIKVRYLHSEIDSLERVVILRELRMAVFDVLVGVNLLREGLDLPEVSLVAILGADKQGFLRSERSLFQIAGRASRNSEGLVVFYADKISVAMKSVIDETKRRRELQIAYNKERNIVPKSIYKSAEEINKITSIADMKAVYKPETKAERTMRSLGKFETLDMIDTLTIRMKQAAKDLEFEKAAAMRDEILDLRKNLKKAKR